MQAQSLWLVDTLHPAHTILENKHYRRMMKTLGYKSPKYDTFVDRGLSAIYANLSL